MPSEVRFAVLRRLLESKGWSLARVSGSHHIFEKDGEAQHLSIPVHRGKVKHVYARKVHQILEDSP